MLLAAAFGSRRTDAVIARPTATAAISGGRPSRLLVVDGAGTALATKLSHRTRLAASVLASSSTSISLSLCLAMRPAFFNRLNADNVRHSDVR